MTEYRNALQEILPAVPGPKQGEPIHLYLTGDEDGPDIFGVIYDEEEDALESARENGDMGENEVTVWRVPFIPQLDLAVRIESDADND